MEDDEEESDRRGNDENRHPPVTFTPGSQAWARPYRPPNPPKKTLRKHGFVKQSCELISLNTVAAGDSRGDDKVIWFHCHCGAKFTRRAYLSKHVSNQKNGKVFKCLHPHCLKRFNYHQSLMEHVKKKHKRDYGGREGGGYWCHSCGIHFKMKENHRIHRKNWHAPIKLEKPKIGLPPSPKQPAITQFLKPTATIN